MNSKTPTLRDPRVDVLRGFALLTIFVDHVPHNSLSLVTLRNFGFADAAELFVILAGFSSMMAYGRCFKQRGVCAGLRRIGARCLRLYAYQVALLLALLGIIMSWREYSGFGEPELSRLLNESGKVLLHGIQLRAQPSFLNILPLYIVLLLLFPLLYAGMRVSPLFTCAASASLWAIANFEPKFNLTNWLDGQGWFFNPFAWQFLFMIGAMAALVLAERRGSLPRLPWLAGLCWAYLGFAFLASVGWSAWVSGVFVMPPPDKTNLSWLRLLDVLALMYLFMSSSRMSQLARSRWLAGMEACGRHSLEIFSLGTVLALIGGVLVNSFGGHWAMQIAINATGLSALLVCGNVLENARARQRSCTAIAVSSQRALEPHAHRLLWPHRRSKPVFLKFHIKLLTGNV
jgi:hypothetical protein